MSPPAQRSLSADANSEQVFLFLHEYKQGLCLPNNVLSDSSIYQYPPSKLHQGVWYMVYLREEKESFLGFWKVKEEACKIYSNTVISGWRTTLEYSEGKSPQVKKSDWLMHKYTISRNDLWEKEIQKVSISLCKVFLCNDNSKKEKREPIGDGRVIADFPFTEDDIFLTGDYLELNDLKDPESSSFSSQNSSCPRYLLDEYFDSFALLRDIEEDDKKQSHWRHSSSIYNYTRSGGSDDVLLRTPPSSVFEFLSINC